MEIQELFQCLFIYRSTFIRFSNLPLTVDQAKDAGWASKDVCADNLYFRGNRFILDNEPAVMLLFDSSGKIAGIQCGVPKSKALGSFFKKEYWIEDRDWLVVTAYFVDPNGICNGGRKESKFLGDSLSIQTGKTPDSLKKFPLKQDDADKSRWVKGKCIWGMGQHYWYNISMNMSCDDFFPAFILYNKGKLNAFGWVTMGDFESSRYEHPPTRVLDYFFQSETQPICVKSVPKLSTVHIYFDRMPYFNFC